MLCLLVAFSAAACSEPQNSVSPASSGEDQITEAPTPSGEDQNAEETQAAGEHLTIGYAAPDLTAEFNMRVQKELEAACETAGMELITLSAEGDVNMQVTQVENFITMGVDALIIFPTDPKTLSEPMKKARDAGIYVVNADQIADPGSYDIGISVDMKQLGVVCNQMASDWIDETFPDAEPGSVKCAVIGLWMLEQTGARCDVMADLASYNDKVEMVEVYDEGADYATKIPQDVSILLQKHPDINVILSYTDTFAMLADEAILQNASTYGLDLSKIGQFTVDWSAAGLYKIKESQTNESTLRGTAATNITIAQFLLDAVTQKIDPSELDENNIFMGPITPVTIENIDEYLDNAM